MFVYPEKGNLTLNQISGKVHITNGVFCRDILGRHKEILTEIFYFTKHPDVPPDSDSILEQAMAESTDLKEFLNVNDLERLLPYILECNLMCN